MPRKPPSIVVNCEACGGPMKWRWVNDPRIGAEWFTDPHRSIDCIKHLKSLIDDLTPPKERSR